MEFWGRHRHVMSPAPYYALTAPAADVAAAVDELPQLGTLTVAALEGTA